MVPHRIALALTLMLAAGCQQTVYLTNGDAGAPNDAFTFGEHGGFGQCMPMPYYPQVRLPEVILMVDRSSAMQTAFGNNSTRLAATLATLKSLIPANPAVRFGYGQLPTTSLNGCGPGGPGGGDACCAGDIYPPSPTSFSVFDGFIQGCDKAPCGSNQRPIGDALMRCRSAYDQDPNADRYVVLVTGGEPNCTSDSTSPCSDAQNEAARLSNAGIRTYVVAVGDELASDKCLNDLAVAGNRPRGGPQSYYLATAPADLTSSLSTIIHDEIARDACTFDVFMPNGGTDKLTVYFNGNPLPQSFANGWNFDNGNMFRITLYGDACENYIDGGGLQNAILIVPGRAC